MPSQKRRLKESGKGKQKFDIVFFNFIGKGKLEKITKEKCVDHVNIVCNAIEEIANGLQEENTTEEKVQWQQKLHDILLYKVCQSCDTDQPIIDDDTVLDKTEMLSQIFPTIGSVFYAEIIKKCGWSSLFLARLDSLPVDIAYDVLLGVTNNSSSVNAVNDSDVVLLIDILDYILSKLLSVSSGEVILPPNIEDSSCSQKCLTVSIISTMFKTLHDYDLVKFCENISNGNTTSHIFPHVDRKLFLQDFTAQLLMLGVMAATATDLNVNHLKNWVYLNIMGQEIDFNETDDILPSRMFYKINGLGKYDKMTQRDLVLELNIKSVSDLQKDFPWTMWTSIMNIFLLSGVLQSNTIPTIHLSKCPQHLKFQPPLSSKSSATTKAVTIICSLPNLVAICQQMSSGRENLLLTTTMNKLMNGIVENVDYTLETVIWRIEKRQSGFQECIEELLKNKYPQTWTNNELMMTLQNNIDLLAVDMTLTRMYDMVVELEDKLSESAVIAVKKLVTSAFVKLSPDTKDRHIYDLYKKYRYWPSHGSLSTGEITAAFNKLTSCGPSSKVNDVYKQVLQNPELVLQNIVERAMTSKDQVTIYTEILNSMPSICTANYHGNRQMTLLVYTLDNFLKKQRLGTKEQKNVLKFVMETSQVTKGITGSGSLLNPIQFLTNTVLPYLNMDNLYSNSQPITASFAFELFMDIVEALPRMQKDWNDKKEQEHVGSVLTEIHFPAVFLCICELAHQCIDLNESDELLLSEKLKVKAELYTFWAWLDYHTYIREEFLQIKSGWFKEKMKRFDFTIQLLILAYTAPIECEQMCQNLCTELVKSQENTMVLNIIRMFSVNSTTFEKVNRLFDDVEIQFNYNNTVLALVQILPNLVEGEWKNCLCFVNRMYNLHKLAIPDRIQDVKCEPLIDTLEGTELVQSKILQEVTTLLQYTDVRQNKLALNNYLKCYIQYINDFIIKDDEECQNTIGQRSYILSEVFNHVVSAIWWMDESDSEPCNVILLDIVCSLEVIEIEDTLKQALIYSIEDNVCLIKSTDTSAMIGKKLQKILKSI